MKKIQKGGLRRRFSIGAAGARSGLGLLASRASGLMLSKEEQKAHNEAALEREAQRFVSHLGELKGAYVKIGQMLALYGEHILPRAVTDALHTLEAKTKPLEWGAVESVVEQELPDCAAQLEIDKNAIAAASLAQVHRANQKASGQDLALKIQYPGIADAIEDDFKHVIQMLSLARWVKSGRQLNELAKELRVYLLRETDYAYELNTAQKVADYLKADNRYKVPNYHSSFCTNSVLTMDFIEGHAITDPQVQDLSQERRNRIGEAMLELFFKELFEWQLMQTDPNFGNYRIEIDNDTEQDRLVLLDFGAVHPLPETFSESVKKTILAAQRQDMAGTAEGLIELRCLRQNDTQEVKDSFAGFCCFILEPFHADFGDAPDYARIETNGEPLYNWRTSRLLKRAGRLGSQQVPLAGFRVPPSEFMLMVRKLTGVFTFLSALGAQTNSVKLLEKYR